MSQDWKALCDAMTACLNTGGTWHYLTDTCGVDAGTDGGGDGGND
jgi:hypothetical protein